MKRSAVTCGMLAVALAAAAAGKSAFVFHVRSSIDGKTTFGHRVHWVAYPNLPESKILAVEFLIDGKLSWVEHHRPYTYGGLDGDNYLITSWLTPGRHRFAVIAFGPQGARTTDTVSGRVLPSASPPTELVGSWKSYHSAAGTSAGNWTLTISKVGWRITDPNGGGNLIDVAYLTQPWLQLRTGIWTKPHSGQEGNGWCEDTNVSVRFSWTIRPRTLALAHQGTDNCGESEILDGEWTRAS